MWCSNHRISMLMFFTLIKECIFLTLLRQNFMSESDKRISTRERKPNRFLILEEPEYGNYSASRAPDQRDARTGTAEYNQIAKLFVKLINNANKRYKEKNSHDTVGGPHGIEAGSLENQRSGIAGNRLVDRRSNGIDTMGNGANRRSGEQIGNGFEKISRTTQKTGDKKGQSSNKHGQHITSIIDQDLELSHQKGRITTQSQMSGQTLLKISLQRQQMDQSAVKQAEQKQRKKKTFHPLEIKSIAKQQKQELKPFKRQSYHVAIAYHIHLKQVRAGTQSSAKDIDPTFNARKLRQQQGGE